MLAPAPGAADPATAGAALYADHCLRCHGPAADANEAGDITGLSLRTISSAVRAGPGMMPVLQLDDAEIAAVTAFLDRLGRE